jgi:hypothetical protein
MSSKSEEKVTTQTENIAVDRRMVLENGQQVIDSVINDNSPEAIKASLGPLVAAWQTMVSGNSLNLFEVTQLASDLMGQVNRSQVNLNDTAQDILQAGLDEFDGLLKQNRLTVDLVDGISDRSFDQSDKALDLLAEVKTGDFADLSKAIMLFALAALYITARK